VVTDGKGNPVACKEQCRAAQALGITVIGIGIQEDVGDVYPNAVRINKVEDLGGVVFSQIKIAA
jgi:cobalamin biosynthesis protein CobT